MRAFYMFTWGKQTAQVCAHSGVDDSIKFNADISWIRMGEVMGDSEIVMYYGKVRATAMAPDELGHGKFKGVRAAKELDCHVSATRVC